MKNNYYLSLLCCIAAAGTLILCSTPPNPYIPANARIADTQPFSNIPLDVVSDSSYETSFTINMPTVVDSYYVTLHSITSEEYSVSKGVAESSRVGFSVIFPDTGTFVLKAVIIKSDKSRDSISRTIRVLPIIKTLVLPDTISNDSIYAGALHLNFFKIIDRFEVRVFHSIMSTSPRTLESGISSDSIIKFSLFIPDTGINTVEAIIVHKGTKRHTLSRTVYVRSYAPSLLVMPTSDTIFCKDGGDSVVFTFIAKSIEGNLWEFNFKNDTSGAFSTQPFRANRLFCDTIKKTIFYNSFDTLIYSSYAVDAKIRSSPIVRCTIFVFDTIGPLLTKIAPLRDTIITLPVVVSVRASDHSKLDSVVFIDALSRRQYMNLRNDTAFLAIDLEAGKNYCKIEAFDKAKNKGTLNLPLFYKGETSSAPIVRNFVKIVPEGFAFDTLWLDTIVELKGTSYSKSAIKWNVVPDKNHQLVIDTSKLSDRKLVVKPPNAEWNGTELIKFIAIPPDNEVREGIGTFRVEAVNDTPIITLTSICTDTSKPFDTLLLNKCAVDPDNDSTTLSWDFSKAKGKYFYAVAVEKNPRKAVVLRIPPEGAPSIQKAVELTDTLVFAVADPHGAKTSKRVEFKVRYKCPLQYEIITPIFDVPIKLKP